MQQALTLLYRYRWWTTAGLAAIATLVLGDEATVREPGRESKEAFREALHG